MLIVDGSSLLATSYYASLPRAIRKEKDDEKKEELYPTLLKNDGNGHYCNALELFFHTLFTIMTFQRPSHLVVCWDAGRNTFRKELWQLYKSNRQSTPTPLRQQFELAYEICDQLGIAQVRDSRYEADDFAGTIASKMSSQIPVRIYTRDKDYFQLINDRVKIWYGMADLKKVKEWRKVHHMPPCLPSRVVLIDRHVLKKEFGYYPESVPMIKCLFGDASDNIPGVSGMGESRSIKLAAHYASLDELYQDVEHAKSKNERKNLNRLWRSWGIYVSPYTALTKKATQDRKSAKEMAQICYTLGKIRTDLDLEDCFEQGLTLDQFACYFDADQIDATLKNYAIDLKIAHNKMKSSDRHAKARMYDEYKEAKSPNKKKSANTNGKAIPSSKITNNAEKRKSNAKQKEAPSAAQPSKQAKRKPANTNTLDIKQESLPTNVRKPRQQQIAIDFDLELEKMFSMTIANRDQIMEDNWRIQEDRPDQNNLNSRSSYAKPKPKRQHTQNGTGKPKTNPYSKPKVNSIKQPYRAKRTQAPKGNQQNDVSKLDSTSNNATSSPASTASRKDHGQNRANQTHQKKGQSPRLKANRPNTNRQNASRTNRNGQSSRSNQAPKNKRAQTNRKYSNQAKAKPVSNQAQKEN